MYTSEEGEEGVVKDGTAPLPVRGGVGLRRRREGRNSPQTLALSEEGLYDEMKI